MSRFTVALNAAAVLAALPASASGAISNFKSPTGKLGSLFSGHGFMVSVSKARGF